MESNASSPPQRKGFVHRYITLLRRFRFLVLLFWVACFGVGAFQGLQLLAHTAIAIEAPSGSQADSAHKLFQQEFPNVANLQPVVAVLERSPSVLGLDVSNFTQDLLMAVCAHPGGYLKPQNFQSYYTLIEQGLDILASSLVSDDGTMTIIIMNVELPGTMGDTNGKDYITWLDDTSSYLAKQAFAKHDVTVRLTGDLVFGRDVEVDTEHDILVLDGIAFPIALSILAFVLRSFRLLLIPIVCISVSILTSFLLVLPVALNTMMISFTPSLMMSTTIAMSIDYSLFLLSRFREELLASRPAEVAIENMVATSGHTVLVSGLTISMCFAGLAFFNVAMLSIPGLSTAIALIVAIIVNLSLTPTLLLTFPKFFSRSVLPWHWPWKPAPAMPKSATPLVQLQDNDDDGPHDAVVAGAPDSATLRASLWFRFGRFVTKRSLLVVLVVVGLAVPCAMRGVVFDRTMSLTAFTSRTSAATQSFMDLNAKFGTGRLFPYDLIAIPPPSMPLFSPAFFAAMGDIVSNDLMPLPANATFLGITVVTIENQVTIISFDQIAPCLGSCTADLFCPLFCSALQSFVNAGNTSTYLSIFVDVAGDPFGPAGKQWMLDARAAVAAASTRTGISLTLAEGATAEFDLVDQVYGVFPTAIAITTALVFVLIGVAFRSLVVPARAVLSIALTLAYVYGCTVWVYENGALDFLHITSLSGQGSLSWIAPVMAFSVLVGLGLDYDIFLLTRIREYRQMGVADPGKDDANNVLLGLTMTGRVITAAGLIMAVAFVGLLFSAEPVLNELSFFLVFAVLLDTLLVRSVLVPCLMTLLGRFNWWPGDMRCRSRGEGSRQENAGLLDEIEED